MLNRPGRLFGTLAIAGLVTYVLGIAGSLIVGTSSGSTPTCIASAIGFLLAKHPVTRRALSRCNSVV